MSRANELLERFRLIHAGSAIEDDIAYIQVVLQSELAVKSVAINNMLNSSGKNSQNQHQNFEEVKQEYKLSLSLEEMAISEKISSADGNFSIKFDKKKSELDLSNTFKGVNLGKDDNTQQLCGRFAQVEEKIAKLIDTNEKFVNLQTQEKDFKAELESMKREYLEKMENRERELMIKLEGKMKEQEEKLKVDFGKKRKGICEENFRARK